VCGNVVLERVAGVPPIRPLTRSAMVVGEYAGEMIVIVRCDPRYFRPEDTRAFLEAYVQKLRETIGEDVV
jgi:hypothetical protein